jgi:hypothetical protein
VTYSAVARVSMSLLTTSTYDILAQLLKSAAPAIPFAAATSARQQRYHQGSLKWFFSW